MRPYLITQKARADLKDIGRYTRNQWGKRQRDHYLHVLNARFQWIADNPLLGLKRPDVDPDFLCYPEGEHLIFYMITDDTVAIIGLPHKRMDIPRYFQA